MNKAELKRLLDVAEIPYGEEETNKELQAKLDNVMAPRAAVPNAETGDISEPAAAVEIPTEVKELGYKAALARKEAELVAALAKESNPERQKIVKADFDKELEAIKATRFSTQNVKYSEMAQKALESTGVPIGLGGSHPYTKVKEETLIATYTFDFTLDEIEAKIKEYKIKISAKADKQRKIERSLASIF